MRPSRFQTMIPMMVDVRNRPRRSSVSRLINVPLGELDVSLVGRLPPPSRFEFSPSANAPPQKKTAAKPNRDNGRARRSDEPVPCFARGASRGRLRQPREAEAGLVIHPPCRYCEIGPTPMVADHPPSRPGIPLGRRPPFLRYRPTSASFAATVSRQDVLRPRKASHDRPVRPRVLLSNHLALPVARPYRGGQRCGGPGGRA